jgi:hypothetical protein
MKCEAVRAQLTAYLDGELPDDRGSAVRGHLRSCEACRTIATEEAALRDEMRALPPLDPPARLWAGVQARLAAAEVADAERPAWRRALARWASRAPRAQIGIAGLAVAAAIIIIVIRMQRDEPQKIASAPPPQQTVKLPENVKPAPMPIAPERDVAEELAAAPTRQTQDYAQAARELEELAKDARSRWTDEQKQQFDKELVVLHGEIDRAKDERGRQRAYRTLIRYVQRAAVRDDVALAGVQ